MLLAGLSCMPFPVTSPKFLTNSTFPYLAMSGLLVKYGAVAMAIGAVLSALSFAIENPE
jgi:hypothetical protein